MDMFVIALTWLCSLALVAVLFDTWGWRRGRKLGQREGFQKYLSQLRFEKRDHTLIIPTDQPHSRRPKGRARQSDAHFSQPRRTWSGE